jgi:aspartyl-tRNA(Asn)/glutamyl-tRNA(Gln) amidotransferase subunit A
MRTFGSLGIKDLQDGYRAGRLSPVVVIEDALSLAEETHDALRAFVTISRVSAMAEAEALEAALRRGELLPPLAGVPITVKDVIATAGIRTTNGSPAFADSVPAADAVSVFRLRQAGAIVIGKTATPEFACRQTTSSLVSGIARNPWDLALTPGGSSGGSAAATAAGIGTVSVVTDGGGSARLPAACTGIAGFKPTFGKIPFDTALDGFAGLGHIGLMARTVVDVATVLPIAAGPCHADPVSLATARGSAGFELQSGHQPLAGLRIGWRERLADEPVETPILDRVRRALNLAADLGAAIVTLDGVIEPPLPIWQILQHSIWAERYEDRFGMQAAIDPVIRAGIKHAGTLSARDLQSALHGRTRLFRQVQLWFESCDVILSPTLTRAPLAAEHPGSGPIDVAGRSAGDIREVWAPLLGLFTMTGHPALNLNCGWTDDGVPVGLHLVGRWHDDDRVLAVGRALEARLEAFPRPALPRLSLRVYE